MIECNLSILVKPFMIRQLSSFIFMGEINLHSAWCPLKGHTRLNNPAAGSCGVV